MTETLRQLARQSYELATDVAGLGLDRDPETQSRLSRLLEQLTQLRNELAGRRLQHLQLQRERNGLSAHSSDLKLHLGCGEHALPGWVNVDIAPAPFEWNVHWGLPFADGAASHVFVSHLLEHLYFPNDAGAFLGEVLRVMAPGARVRLIVPDVAQLIAAYQRQDRAFFAERARHWRGAQGEGPLLAQFLNYAGVGAEPGYLFEAHKYGYDFETLKALLEQTGFVDVEASAYMASTDLALRHDDASEVARARHPQGHYSLFVEACKPRPVRDTLRPPAPASVDERVLAERAARMQAARAAMTAGRRPEAIALLRQLHLDFPLDPQIARSLGVLLLEAGALDEAEAALLAALALEPKMAAARLHLGRIHLARGQRGKAVAAFLRAITHAQAGGQWLDQASTPPQLTEHVLAAMALVEAQRVPLLASLLDPLEQRFGAGEIRRIRMALDHYLGRAMYPPPHPMQAPLFLHVPGLNPRPWLEPERLPWLAALEAHTETIAAEAQALSEGEWRPFLDSPAGVDLQPYLSGVAARWDAFFFYRHGEAFAANHRAAPVTAAALQQVPLVRIREHAPEICFSVLAPGTHIKPHHGVTNARVVVHLPLLIPEGCTLTVAGEQRAWQRGRAWVFDDTFLHEALNPAETRRIILLMDAWNPDLTEAEQLAFTELVEALGQFNQGNWSGP